MYSVNILGNLTKKNEKCLENVREVMGSFGIDWYKT